jgi:hypothetical protein
MTPKQEFSPPPRQQMCRAIQSTLDRTPTKDTANGGKVEAVDSTPPSRPCHRWAPGGTRHSLYGGGAMPTHQNKGRSIPRSSRRAWSPRPWARCSRCWTFFLASSGGIVDKRRKIMGKEKLDGLHRVSHQKTKP